MTTPLEILEDLMDDDLFIRQYPSLERYVNAWDEMGGADASKVPREVIFEFYAEKLPPDQALHIWFTYDPFTQLLNYKEIIKK